MQICPLLLHNKHINISCLSIRFHLGYAFYESCGIAIGFLGRLIDAISLRRFTVFAYFSAMLRVFWLAFVAKRISTYLGPLVNQLGL